MKRLLKSVIFAALVISSPHHGARAGSVAEVIPDFKSCPALRDETSYGEKYDDYSLLLQGKDGYIFRSQQDFRVNFDMSDESITLYQEFSEALRKKGVDLMVAFTPTRGMGAKGLLPDGDPLTKAYDSDLARKNYKDFLNRMNKAGVTFIGTPDIKSGARYFYKADQHWTTDGASEMARAIADVVKEAKSYKSIPKIAFTTSPSMAVTFEGRFNLALESICDFHVPDEVDMLTTTAPSVAGVTKADLFGDLKIPEIVIVGTSYSKREDHDLNFEGYLKEYLSADVYNAAISGGGLDDSLIAYLVSPEFRKNPPKFLIWEIPGYYDLDGEAGRKTILQALPAVYGDCKNPIAEEKGVKLAEKNVTLMDNLQDRKINSALSYLYLSFATPVKKNFSVSFINEDKSKESLKFKRSKRYPHDGEFFAMPGKKHESFLKSVTVSVPVEIQGMDVDVKLCPVP